MEYYLSTKGTNYWYRNNMDKYHKYNPITVETHLYEVPE